jgi:hypothetical protein
MDAYESRPAGAASEVIAATKISLPYSTDAPRHIPVIVPDDLAGALDVARALIKAGVPIFLAHPATDQARQWIPDGGAGGCGYWIPPGWENTVPDESVIDLYTPGDGVGAVMVTVNGLDCDVQKGGFESRDCLKNAGLWPQVIGLASTPSGGTHELVAPLGVGSRDRLLPGLDVKGSKPDGSSRGFLWIAPTIKLSKTTGEPAPYRWIVEPMIGELDPADDSGVAIAELIRETQRGSDDRPEVQGYDGPPFTDMPSVTRAKISRWVAGALAGVEVELRASAAWPVGHTDDKKRGWERLQADCAYRLGRLARSSWNDLSMTVARQAFVRFAPTDAGWTANHVVEKFRVQSKRGTPLSFPASIKSGQDVVATLTHLPRVQRSLGGTWARVAEKAPEPLRVDHRPNNDVPIPMTPAGTALTTAEVLDTQDVAGGVEGDPDSLRQRFPRLDLATLLSAERPPREWVVDGLIPAGTSVALIAPAGTGKSLLLLGCMIAVARGDRDFAGLPISRRRRVLLIDMENTEDDLADRLTALGIAAVDVTALDRLVILHLPPLLPLDTPDGGSELISLLDAYEVGAGDVVVLDSLQRVVKGPEDKSDTLRDFVRCVGMALKRRKVTVIRTDNMGRDEAKGARGTTGKRDDVDVELLLTRTAAHPGQLKIKPGKLRLPGITSVLINREVDDDGRLTFNTAGDPFRARVAHASGVLEALNIPVEAGDRKAAPVIAASGQVVTREALRAAIKERKNPLGIAPDTDGAPLDAEAGTECAEQSRRTHCAPVENRESEHENRAE